MLFGGTIFIMDTSILISKQLEQSVDSAIPITLIETLEPQVIMSLSTKMLAQKGKRLFKWSFATGIKEVVYFISVI